MPEVDSLVYHNTTADFTGKPAAAKLTSLEGDYNNFKIKSDILNIFAQLAGVGAGISDITQPSATTLQIELTDGAIFGPFTIPSATMNGRGVWTPGTSYAVNDLIIDPTYSAIYVVPFAHTSATTFDPGANDGDGNNFYDLVFDFSLASSGLVKTATATETGTTHVVSSADLGKFWLCTNVAGCAITIPPDSTYSAPLDSEITFRQCAAGGMTFEATAPATFNDGVTAFEAATEDLGAVVTIKKIADDTWIGFGRLSEPTA